MADQSFRLAQIFSNTGHAFSHLFMLIYPTVVIALESEFSLPYHRLIGLILIGNILFGAAALPAGYLGDKWGAVRLMVLFFAGTGTGSILVGMASTEIQLASGFAVVGLFGAIYHPVGIAWVARRVVNRGKALGFNGVFGSIGVGLAPILAAVLTDFWSWRAAFILPGIISIVIGCILAVMFIRGKITDGETANGKEPSEATETEMKRGVLLLLITVACTGLIYQATSFALPKLIELRLSGILGEGLIGVGAIVSVIYFLSGGAQLIGGWLADRFKLTKVYLVCWLLQIPLLVLAAIIHSGLLIPVLAAMVVSNTIGSPAENSLFAKYSPPKWRSTAFGIKFVLALGVASASIPLISWVFAETGEFVWLFLMLTGLSILATVIAAFLPADSMRNTLTD
ncbi:MAG: MFS transporter [Rhodospirillaceae bacterium]|nr:MFS transporter [Rhodospirillaceae bacterium]MBT6308021.1 MFS transporter [Rhodospirillaceae bacterium]